MMNKIAKRVHLEGKKTPCQHEQVEFIECISCDDQVYFICVLSLSIYPDPKSESFFFQD